MEEHYEGLFPAYKIWMNAKAITSRQALSIIATEISVNHINIRANRPIPPKTKVTLSFGFEKNIKVQGNVAWVLDTKIDTGEHFYLTGIKTDFIMYQYIKAIGVSERSRLLQDVLFEIMDHSKN